MSEFENQAPAPAPAPSKQTSSVPLKKETVRVTLKASDAPPSIPSATVPMAPPVRPPIPGGGAPPMPGGAPRPPMPAPTIPLRTAAAPAPTMAPAPTVRLATTPAPASPTRPPLGGAPTMGLPKATMQMPSATPTMPLGSSFSAPALVPSFTEEDDDEEYEDDKHANLLKILTGIGLAAACLVLYLQYTAASTWMNAEDNPNKDAGMSQLYSF